MFDLQGYRKALETAAEEQSAQLAAIREEMSKALDAGDDANLFESAPCHQAIVHTLGAYRYALALLDEAEKSGRLVELARRQRHTASHSPPHDLYASLRVHCHG